jgi:hypothetical protein
VPYTCLALGVPWQATWISEQLQLSQPLQLHLLAYKLHACVMEYFSPISITISACFASWFCQLYVLGIFLVLSHEPRSKWLFCISLLHFLFGLPENWSKTWPHVAWLSIKAVKAVSRQLLAFFVGYVARLLLFRPTEVCCCWMCFSVPLWLHSACLCTQWYFIGNR